VLEKKDLPFIVINSENNASQKDIRYKF